MSTTRTRRRVTSLVGAIMLLLPMSVAMAEGKGDPNRPVEVTFTKWVLLNSVNMEGVTGGAVPGVFVGETLLLFRLGLVVDRVDEPGTSRGRSEQRQRGDLLVLCRFGIPGHDIPALQFGLNPGFATGRVQRADFRLDKLAFRGYVLLHLQLKRNGICLRHHGLDGVGLK